MYQYYINMYKFARPGNNSLKNLNNSKKVKVDLDTSSQIMKKNIIYIGFPVIFTSIVISFCVSIIVSTVNLFIFKYNSRTPLYNDKF